MRRILFLFIPLALFVTACAGDESGGVGASRDGHRAHGGNSEVAEGARAIAVTGESFAFDPPRIEAGTGEDLAIELSAGDLQHDFVVDELGAHIAAGPGETATGGFNAGDQPRTYIYYCSVPGHRDAGMHGELVVG